MSSWGWLEVKHSFGIKHIWFLRLYQPIGDVNHSIVMYLVGTHTHTCMYVYNSEWVWHTPLSRVGRWSPEILMEYAVPTRRAVQIWMEIWYPLLRFFPLRMMQASQVGPVVPGSHDSDALLHHLSTRDSSQQIAHFGLLGVSIGGTKEEPTGKDGDVGKKDAASFPRR